MLGAWNVAFSGPLKPTDLPEGTARAPCCLFFNDDDMVSPVRRLTDPLPLLLGVDKSGFCEFLCCLGESSATLLNALAAPIPITLPFRGS